jgi:hypothetical protein
MFRDFVHLKYPEQPLAFLKCDKTMNSSNFIEARKKSLKSQGRNSKKQRFV